MAADRSATVAGGRQPRADRFLLDRPRLFQLLSKPAALTVVRGPRAAGKSALLRTWLQTQPDFTGVAIDHDSPVAGTSPDDYWHTLSRSIDAVPDSDDPIVVLLDDVDRLGDPAAESHILGLVEGDHRLHVVVTTRSTAVFDDATMLDVDVDVLTISPTDLLFTPAESQAVLQARGIELAPHLLETVQTVTGGFPPLVQAAVAVARPFGTDYEDSRELARRALERSIDRYVERTILSDPDLAGLRQFMLTISAARTVSDEVATVLTDDDTAPQQVRALESAGLLVRSMWPRDTEWRFPQPIRESLMRDLRLEAPQGPLCASAALARWFLERGDLDPALAHAVEGQDWELTVSILKSNWVELVSRHFRLVRESLLALPAEAAEGDLSIKAGRELFLRFGADSAGFAAPTVPSYDTDVVETDAAAVTETLAVGTVQSLILRVAGDFERADEMTTQLSALADRALKAQHGKVTEFLPLLRLQWGITHQLRGDLTQASTELRRAHHGNRPAGTDFVARNAAGNLALGYALTGELTHADSWLERERRYDDAGSGMSAMVRVGGLIASALVALDRMDVTCAAKALSELGDLPDDEELWAFAAHAHCQAALVTGNAEQGLDRLHRATAVYDRWFTSGSVAAPLLAATEADLYSALGRGNDTWTALEKARGRGPWTAIARARMDLSSGYPASTLAGCARPVVSNCPYPRIRMESALLQSVAHLDMSNAEPAVALLKRAVALFEQTGLVRPFASMSENCIGRLVGLGVDLPAAWLSAVPPAGREVFPERIRMVGISDRESAVLEALASTPSVAEIAAQLYVSQNTVKTQLRSLYRKLGVHSRADALLTATRLGLLTSRHDSDS
ncbi:LuxR family maltose regulon positive regulatory protein [Rhodococcus sp. OK519]|uniref:LuxR C-terminal-related transcriptional regulator n=1 Tax=Rhodococcus sp. OK519 TaxID=2135729 RepID=UPI000D3B5F8C|nr:LuxR family maltose regulon positive regulatory protein [Rhodococcus sp. OK519]